MKTKTKITQSKTGTKVIEACIDRPTSVLNLHRTMYNSIKHNPENNPTTAGTADHDLVKRFIENPHQSFSSEHTIGIARLALITGNMWQKGTTLTISFLDGSTVQKNKSKKFAKYWMSKAGANIKLKFIAGKMGMIRISFVADPGSWSFIGTECLSIAANKPTMNFGWLRNNTSDAEYERVVVHEFGHALGCIHEHNSPAGGIKWNKPVVYKYYEGPPNNWSKADVDSNLFEKYSANLTQFTKLDPDSIMMYPIPKEFTTDGFSVGLNLHLSPTDIGFIKKEYPQ